MFIRISRIYMFFRHDTLLVLVIMDIPITAIPYQTCSIYSLLNFLSSFFYLFLYILLFIFKLLPLTCLLTLWVLLHTWKNIWSDVWGADLSLTINVHTQTNVICYWQDCSSQIFGHFHRQGFLTVTFSI